MSIIFGLAGGNAALPDTQPAPPGEGSSSAIKASQKKSPLLPTTMTVDTPRSSGSGRILGSVSTNRQVARHEVGGARVLRIK